jgi:hypothetical protein
MSLYTPEVREYIRSRDWPKGLVMDVYENDDPAPHLNIIFFRDNWLTLSGEQQLQVTQIVKEVMAKLWGKGIPTYTGKMEASNGGSGLAT